MHPNIIVLAAGVASRMRRSLEKPPAGREQLVADARGKAKAMIGIGPGARPFMDYLLRNIAGAGYRNLILVVGETDTSIREYYDSRGGGNRFPDLGIHYAVQPIPHGRKKPAGTADAVLRALAAFPDWKQESFTVCNSDNLYSIPSLRLLLESDFPNTMIDYDRTALGFPTDRIAQFAILRKDADGFLEDIIEKPSEVEIAHHSNSSGRVGVSMNLFRFRGVEILPFLESVPMHPVRDEKELPVAVRMMVQQRPRSLLAIPRSEQVIDLTSIHDVETVQAYLHRMYPDMT
jgi:glucose-1-phosphate adenylyltransferase